MAIACKNYGYQVIPSQTKRVWGMEPIVDLYDNHCMEWLVEVPVEVPWASLPSAEAIEIEKFSAAAQFNFYMQVQRHYSTHNTSGTIELCKEEILSMAHCIFEAIDNEDSYISVSLLARFNTSRHIFPHMPFEPIDKRTYHLLCNEMIQRRDASNFHTALANVDHISTCLHGPMAYDSDKCLL